jgi:exopolyphosphatase/guanosine-5'-triphosphate,3'-diphosphate pyrophosphatase
MPETIAIIDMGTNTFNMLLVERNERDEFAVKGKFKEAVKLGEGGITSGRIADAAFQRGIAALQLYRQLIDSAGVNEIFAFATSAIRSAENGPDFVLAAKETCGIEVKVINGNEEASLIHEGVKNGVHLPRLEPVLLLDIGGGSVEFAVSQGGSPLLLRSLNIGAARLLEKINPSDPVSPTDLQKLEKLFETELGGLISEIREFDINMMVGSSGSCEMIASMVAHANGDKLSANKLNGYTFTTRQFEKIHRKIIKSSRKERLNLQGMEPLRAEMITMASSLCAYMIKSLEIKKMMVSTSALKEGVFYRYLRDEQRRIDRYLGSPDRSLRAKAIKNLGKRYGFEAKHGVQCSAMATQLFQALKPIHGFGPEELELLQYAAAIHDIGRFVNPSGHHKHGQYIIMNSDLPGFSTNELVMMANLVRYHRKSLPKGDHFHYKIMSDRKKKRVQWLGGILRLADNLDRGHRNLITDLDADWDDNTLTITVKAKDDVSMEIDHAVENRHLLEMASGKELVIRSIR